MQYIAVVSKKPLRGGAKIGAEKESKIIKIKKKNLLCLWCADLPFCIPLGFFPVSPCSPREHI